MSDKPEITTTEPSGLCIETETAIVHVPQTIESEGGDAVAAYVEQQIAALPQ